MKEFIDNIISHLNWEEIVDFCDTVIHERYEILLIALAVVFIMVVCLSTILERIHERGGIAIVPVYRFTVLFSKIGLHPALSLLMIVPGVNLIIRIVFYVFLVRKFNRSYAWVPFLVLFPVVALPIIAFGEGHCMRVKVPARKAEEPVSRKAVTAVRKEVPSKVVSRPAPKPEKEEEGIEDFERELEKIVEQDKHGKKSVAKARPARVEAQRPVVAHRPTVSRPVAKPVVRRASATARPAAMRRTRPEPMPLVQGLSGADISFGVRRAAKTKSEYELLLEKQQAAQRRRDKYGASRGTGGSLNTSMPKKVL